MKVEKIVLWVSIIIVAITIISWSFWHLNAAKARSDWVLWQHSDIELTLKNTRSGYYNRDAERYMYADVITIKSGEKMYLPRLIVEEVLLNHEFCDDIPLVDRY